MFTSNQGKSFYNKQNESNNNKELVVLAKLLTNHSHYLIRLRLCHL